MLTVSFDHEKIWTDIEQNTDAWLDMRIGKVGGSTLAAIMANFGKAFGPPAHAAALKIALERITGHRQEQTFNSYHLERGHAEEPVAIALYEETTFTKVENGGYYQCGELIGVSPDGRPPEGLLEAKSVIDTVHWATLTRNAFDPKYKWQMLLEMGGSGRPWVDFAEYCSVFPEGKRLFIDRLYADDYKEDMVKIEERLNEFAGLIDEKVKFINGL